MLELAAGEFTGHYHIDWTGYAQLRFTVNLSGHGLQLLLHALLSPWQTRDQQQPSAASILGQRLRRWTRIDAAPGMATDRLLSYNAVAQVTRALLNIPAPHSLRAEIIVFFCLTRS